MNKPDWPKLTIKNKKPEGVLLDHEIAEAMGDGQLIRDGDDARAKYSCYEVTIGPHIQQLVMDGDHGSESDLYRVRNIGDDGILQVNPNQTYMVYAAEKLEIPADVFAITIPVGNMFKLGLSPETTFADPGFSGEFYVTICNFSPRIVSLKVGDPLARVFFFQLSDRPTKIHESKPREVPPSITRVPRPDLSDLVEGGEAAVIKDVLDTVDSPHYEHAFVTERLYSHYQKSTNDRLGQLRREAATTALVTLATFFIAILIGIVYVGTQVESHWPDFFANLIAEFVGAIIISLVIVLGIKPLRKQLFDALGVLRTKAK